MRLRDMIDLVATADLPSLEDGELLDEAKPRGSLDAEQWRKQAEKQKRIAQKKSNEVTRHAQKMRDLAAQAAAR